MKNHFQQKIIDLAKLGEGSMIQISLIDMPFTHAANSPLTLLGHKSFEIKTNIVLVDEVAI